MMWHNNTAVSEKIKTHKRASNIEHLTFSTSCFMFHRQEKSVSLDDEIKDHHIFILVVRRAN